MLAEVTMGLQSAKAALDLAKGLNAATNQTAINDVKLALQQHIFTAQQALLAAQEAQASATKRISELEQEIMRIKDWEAQKQRYELQQSGKGTFVYTLKAGMENGEPPHQICANCYEHGHKSILQIETRFPGRRDYFVCQRCGKDAPVQGVRDIQ